MITSRHSLKFIEKGHIDHMFAHFHWILKHKFENLYPIEHQIERGDEFEPFFNECIQERRLGAYKFLDFSYCIFNVTLMKAQ